MFRKTYYVLLLLFFVSFVLFNLLCFVCLFLFVLFIFSNSVYLIENFRDFCLFVSIVSVTNFFWVNFLCLGKNRLTTATRKKWTNLFLIVEDSDGVWKRIVELPRKIPRESCVISFCCYGSSPKHAYKAKRI